MELKYLQKLQKHYAGEGVALTFVINPEALCDYPVARKKRRGWKSKDAH